MGMGSIMINYKMGILMKHSMTGSSLMFFFRNYGRQTGTNSYYHNHPFHKTLIPNAETKLTFCTKRNPSVWPTIRSVAT